jgi:hypothetical protein
MLCITECMTGVELRHSLLTQVMPIASQNGHFADSCEGVGFFYTPEGEGNTTAKGFTRDGGSGFRVVA